MRWISVVLNRLLKSLAAVALAALIVMVAFYLFSPVYRFSEPKPFSGSKIYNPYQNLDSKQWVKSNFHCHTRLTDGKNPLKEVMAEYKKFGYSILAVSDHNVILSQGLPADQEIPAYEHGINILMYHSVVIGATRSSIFDFVPYYSLSHKYRMLKWLTERGGIVVFDHPEKTRLLTTSDFKYLSYYKMLEVQKGYNRGVLPFYDSALSSGHYSYVLASDDCHDVYNPRKFARAATFVHTPSKRYADVMKALDSGYVFAVMLPVFADREAKLRRSYHLPHLNALKVRNDSVFISISEPGQVRVFGQGGVLKYSFDSCTAAAVPFTAEDTYLRFAAIFPDSVQLFTNPVVRSAQGSVPPVQDLAKVDILLTVAYEVCVLAVMSALIWLLYLLLKSFKHNRKAQEEKVEKGERLIPAYYYGLEKLFRKMT